MFGPSSVAVTFLVLPFRLVGKVTVPVLKITLFEFELEVR